MNILDQYNKTELEKITQQSNSYRDLLKQLGYKSYNGNNHRTLKKRLEKDNIDTSHFYTKPTENIKRTKENVFCENSTATQSVLRRWFEKEKSIEYKCSKCGLSNIWMNKPIVLQLDHINGNNHDNRLENLRWLCPNCHSQTSTFCGKSLKKDYSKPTNYCIDCGAEINIQSTRCISCSASYKRKIKRPSSNELLELLTKHKGNFTTIAKIYNVTDNAVRKWCKYYSIPFHTKDYK